MAGYDVFVSLPTGAGKSLCYLLLPIVFDFLRGHLTREGSGPRTGSTRHSIAVVVSPLKSLMEDQVTKYSSRGLKCTYISHRHQRKSKVVDDVLSGQYQLVFFSPESMLTELMWREMFRSKVYQENLVGVAVDEAHCVEKW